MFRRYFSTALVVYRAVFANFVQFSVFPISTTINVPADKPTNQIVSLQNNIILN